VPTAAGPAKRHIYRYDAASNRTSEQIDDGVTAAAHNNLNQVLALSPAGPIRIEGTVNEPADVKVNGVTARVDATNKFSADVPLAPGAQPIAVVATDGSGNVSTRNYQVTVAGGTARTLTHDLNGNLLNDGAGRTYAWDASNRLVKITQASGVTEFVYDGGSRRVQEKFNGTLIKQWVWCGGPQPCEERDATNTVTKRFYGQGQLNGTTALFYAKDHLGSVREMTDTSGAIRARYDYDPYGRTTKVSGDLEAEFGFTGFYRHQTTGLSLTLYRAYDANLGRWLSVDPIGERGGMNVYGYVSNDPLNRTDKFGLAGWQLKDLLPASSYQALIDKGESLRAAEKAAKSHADAKSLEALKNARDDYQTALAKAVGKVAGAGANAANLDQIAQIIDAAFTDRLNILDPEKILKLGYGLTCAFAIVKVNDCYSKAFTECESKKCDELGDAVKRLCALTNKL
jgi:RHS repeat-associated protein